LWEEPTKKSVAAAQRVADVHQTHQSGALGQLRLEILDIQAAIVRNPDMAQDTTGALSQKLPGHQVAVVLHHREQHLVSFTEIGIAPAASHEVDRLTGIAREDNFASATRANKVSRRRASRFKRLCGTGTELMGTPMNIGVIAAVITLHRIDHLLRLLTRRGVVEIDQGPVIRRFLSKDWKICTKS
jgi:hypothetical protein